MNPPVFGHEVRVGDQLVATDGPFVVVAFEAYPDYPFGPARIAVDHTGRTMTVPDSQALFIQQ